MIKKLKKVSYNPFNKFNLYSYSAKRREKVFSKIRCQSIPLESEDSFLKVIRD